MKKILIGILLFFVLIAIHAQSFLEYYDSELVKVNYQTFSGFSFIHGGVSYTAFFGIEQPLRDIIAANPRTALLIEKHVRNMRTGWIFLTIGILVSLGSYYLAATIPLATTKEDFAWRLGGAIGLGTSGTIFLISGPFFMQAGYNNLFQAVNIYNRDKIRQYKQQ